MRILRISGRGIRSLYEPFEVDFASGALAAGGLVAITGDTGAGKSTLLDAVCLALYGQIPRSFGKSSAKVGPDGLGDADPRNCLSQGAAEGHVEVDFSLEHGGTGESPGANRVAGERRLRGIWRIHRARRKKGGKIQDVTRELVDLDMDKTIAEGTRQVDAAVRELTGLDFDQFRRSVMLAQGDFQAFLKAEARERGILLEAVTGLDIYTRLSIAAHRKGKEIEEELEQIAKELKRLELPTAEAIAAAEADVARIRREIAGAEERREELEAGVRWHARERELHERLAAGRTLLAEARAAAEAADDSRTALRRAEAAWSIRAEIEGFDKAEQTLESAQKKRLGSSQRLAQSELQNEAARKDDEGARTALENERARQQGLRPELDRARILDREIHGATLSEQEATAAHTRAADLLRNARTLLTTFEEKKAQLEQAVLKARMYIEQHGSTSALEADWGRIAQLLRTAQAQHREIELHDNARSEALGRRKAALAALERHREREAATRVEMEHAQQTLTEAEEQLSRAVSETPEEALVETRRRAERVVPALEGAALALEQARAASDKVSQASETEREALAEIARVDGLLAAAQTAQFGLEERLAEARAALERIRSALDLADRRTELADGVPCPLCGALSHPWADGSGPTESLWKQQEDAVRRLDRERKKAENELADLRTTRAAASERQSGARTRADEAGRDLTAHTARANSHLDDARPVLGDLPAPEPVSLRTLGLDWKARNAEASGRLEIIATLRKQHSAMAEKASGARLSLAGATASREKAEQEVASLSREEESWAQRTAVLRGQADELLSQADSLVCPVAPTWKADFGQSPERCIGQLEASVSDFRTRKTAADGGDKALAELAPELASARVAVAERTRLEQEGLESRNMARQAVERLRTMRAALLGGQATTQAERDWAERLEKLTAVSETLTARYSSSRAEERAARELAVATATELDLAALEHTAAADRLEGALCRLALTLPSSPSGQMPDAAPQAVTLSRDQARMLLSQGRAPVDALASKLAELDAAVQRAEEAVRLHVEELEAHRNLPDRPSGTSEDSASGLASARATLGRLRDDERQAATVRTQQRLLEERAASLNQLGDEIRRTGSRWLAMREIIGHNDGATFRDFAQGLTLENLVALANEALVRLAPRYRLVRLESADLELAVLDLDQASDIRPASTLSGGESFLVSLALALGLSRLSSRGTPIRSLFIDEGFGTLDGDRLDSALSTLDLLQSEGRLIGIISHVPELRERIAWQVRVTALGGGRSRVQAGPGMGKPGASQLPR